MTQGSDSKEKGTVTILPATNKKIDLHDSHAIRRELSAVYRDMRNNKIEISDGTKLAYTLNILLKAYETCVIENKLEAIQGELNKR